MNETKSTLTSTNSPLCERSVLSLDQNNMEVPASLCNLSERTDLSHFHGKGFDLIL